MAEESQGKPVIPVFFFFLPLMLMILMLFPFACSFNKFLFFFFACFCYYVVQTVIFHSCYLYIEPSFTHVRIVFTVRLCSGLGP